MGCHVVGGDGTRAGSAMPVVEMGVDFPNMELCIMVFLGRVSFVVRVWALGFFLGSVWWVVACTRVLLGYVVHGIVHGIVQMSEIVLVAGN